MPTPYSQHPLSEPHAEYSSLLSDRLAEVTPAHQALRCHINLSLGHLSRPELEGMTRPPSEQATWPTPKGHRHTWRGDVTRHTWTLGGYATVLDDYALATTTNRLLHVRRDRCCMMHLTAAMIAATVVAMIALCIHRTSLVYARNQIKIPVWELNRKTDEDESDNINSVEAPWREADTKRPTPSIVYTETKISMKNE